MTVKYSELVRYDTAIAGTVKPSPPVTNFHTVHTPNTRTNRSGEISSDRNWEQIFDKWLSGDCFYDETLSLASSTTVIPSNVANIHDT